MTFTVKRYSDFGDKWFFGLAVGLGISLIVLGKSYLVETIKLYICLVAIMFFYGYYCWKSDYFRIRSDKAGDNIYYMGFLFTLASLGISLSQSTQDSFATENIISNFGVALITTIFGVAGRVTFSQLRDTPQEIENESLNSVSDAARNLRKQLDEIVTDFNIFRTTIKQSTNELHIEWTCSLKKQLDDVQNYYSELFDEIKVKNNEIVNQIDLFGKSINNINTSINSIEVPKDVFKNHLKAYLADFNSFFKKFHDTIDSKLQKLEKTTSTLQNVIENEKSLSESVKNISEFTNQQIKVSKQSVTEMINHVESFKIFVDQNGELIENLIKGVEDNLKVFSDMYRNISEETQEHNKKLLDQHGSIISNISKINEEIDSSVASQSELIKALIIKDLPYFSTSLREKTKEIEMVSLSFNKLYENSKKLSELLQKSITTSDYSINGINIVSNKIYRGFNDLQEEIKKSTISQSENSSKIIYNLEKLSEFSEKSAVVLENFKTETAKQNDAGTNPSERKWYNFTANSQR
jgi:hypothetical protein